MRGRLRCLLLVLGLVVPATVAAQAAFDRVQLEIDGTEQRVERARTVVGNSGNAAALSEIDRAVQLQTDARAALAQGRPRIALGLTLRAGAAADRAIAVINGLPEPDPVISQLRRTREILDRARPSIEACRQDRARAVFRAAGDMQHRAEDAAQAGTYLAALQLTMGARDRAQRALRMCNVVDDAHGSAERALQRTDEVIQRAHERLGRGSAGAPRRLLSRAAETQARARQEFQDQRFESSVRLTISARAFASRAARRADRER